MPEMMSAEEKNKYGHVFCKVDIFQHPIQQDTTPVNSSPKKAERIGPWSKSEMITAPALGSGGIIERVRKDKS